MNKLFPKLALALALTVAPVMPAMAASNTVVTDAIRNQQTKPHARVLVAQMEIKSDINPSNIAAATGGGLLGGLIQAAVDADRTKKAEAAIAPIRDQLAGFNADELAVAATRAALTQSNWLQSAELSFSKDSSLTGKTGALDSLGSDAVLFVEYSYDMSPDFSSVRLVAKMQLANKAVPKGKKPDARLSPKFLAFNQNATSIISLANPSKERTENAARWNANGAKLVKDAIAFGFKDFETLLPRGLALTAADVTAMNAKTNPKSVNAGFGGRVVETAPDRTLLWADGFIHVHGLPKEL